MEQKETKVFWNGLPCVLVGIGDEKHMAKIKLPSGLVIQVSTGETCCLTDKLWQWEELNKIRGEIDRKKKMAAIMAQIRKNRKEQDRAKAATSTRSDS